MAALAPSLSISFVKDGKLTPLAVTSDKRLAKLPHVPTLKELGLVNDAVYAWQGMSVPKGTPSERIKKLSDAMQASLADPTVVKKLEELGMESIPSDAHAMKAYVAQEQERWWPMIKARGISNQ